MLCNRSFLFSPQKHRETRTWTDVGIVYRRRQSAQVIDAVLFEKTESLYMHVYITCWMSRPNSPLWYLLLSENIRWQLQQSKVLNCLLRSVSSSADECQFCQTCWFMTRELSANFDPMGSTSPLDYILKTAVWSSWYAAVNFYGSKMLNINVFDLMPLLHHQASLLSRNVKIQWPICMFVY